MATLPLLIYFFWWAKQRRVALLEQFVSRELQERLLKGFSEGRDRFKASLILVAILFLILSLVQPKWGYHWEEIKQRGVDIIIALDVSQSMMSEDVKPNRLERAKRKIIDFIKIVEGDRLGLIAFAGASFLQAPLTLDYGAVRIFLDEIDPSFIPIPGTAVDQAIEQASKAFDARDRSSRVLILITDGEDHSGHPLEAAKKAAESGVKIYTIGIGQEGGAPIPDPERGGFKKDQSGNLILTKLDEETLQKIALETGGSYVRSVTGDLDLEKIYKDIKTSVADKELKSGRQKRFEERFQWPLFFGLSLLFLEVLLPRRRGSQLSWKQDNE